MSIYGPAGLNPNLNSPKKSSKKTDIVTVRVRDIVLSPDHPRFEEVGGWSGLGTIFFSSVNTPGLKSVNSSLGKAKPYFSNSKFYPLKNELVTILRATDFVDSQKNTEREAKQFYYFPPVNGWGGVNHNALPDPIQKGISTSSPRKSYEQVENGAVNREHAHSSKINLGNTFKENSKVKSLYPYEGDYILEGRWGNSIRFGSTVKSLEIPNNWSSEGDEGDPLIILKNGSLPFPSTDPSYIPTVEDIGNDLSSIYLTSTQKIPFFPSSFKTESFGEGDPSPTSPSEYQGNQILLTSGRLILNSQTDGVLVSAPNIIHLSAGDSIHLDSNNKIVLSSGEIYLVDRNAGERAVLGDQLVLRLKLFLEVLEGVGMALTSANSNGIAIPSLNNIGPNLTEVVKDFKSAIEGDNPKILSNNVKLK